MTRAQMLTCLQERRLCWDRHDVQGLVATHAPDGEIVSPMFGTVSGRPEIERIYNRLFEVFGDLTFDDAEPLIDGHRAVQPFRARATHTHEMFGVPPTGRRFEIQGALFFEFGDDGLITRERRLYDFTGLLVQLGVLRPKVTA